MPNTFSHLDPSHYKCLPNPLYKLIHQYLKEEQPFRKAHRLIDTLEWAVKWHSVLAVSDLMREANLSPPLKVLFATGLRSPTLGIWMHFYRESILALQEPSLPFQEWDRLQVLDNKHQLIGFRNSYAHGATPRDEDCLVDCDTYFPILEQLLGSPFFSDLRLAVSGEHGVFNWRGSRKTTSPPAKPQELSELFRLPHCISR